MKYLYSSCFASFLLDEDFKIIDKRRFSKIINSDKSLEKGKWLKEERDLIKKHKGEKFVFIGFKNKELKNITLSQDITFFSEISGLLKKEIRNYYSSNIKITKNNVKAILKESETLKKNFEAQCKNLSFVAGPVLGIKLTELAGSLKKLASMPSSKIQLLGAEKAFFKHLKFGTLPPKHGIILYHPLVLKAKNKGRAARLLADKIAIAARIDYFKGKFIGNKLKKELEEKIE